jgi:G3E family GTPase
LTRPTFSPIDMPDKSRPRMSGTPFHPFSPSFSLACPLSSPFAIHRNITDLLVDQIEFADVLLINKMDLVDAETIARVHRVVAHLNPSAKVIETMRSKVDLKEILNTGRVRR